MKRCLISIFFILNLALALDYTTLSPFRVDDCEDKTRTQSPIIVDEGLCGPYSSFNIKLPDVKLTKGTGSTYDATQSATTGGPTFPYVNSKALEVNGTTWSTTNIVFRHKAEHRLYPTEVAKVDTDEGADYEMQISLEGSNGHIGVLSFLIRKAKDGGQKQSLANAPIFSDDGTTLSVNLGVLTDLINKKLANEIYLNLLTYNGTLTYPTGTGTTAKCLDATWFIYGTDLFIQETSTLITTWVQDLGAANLRSGQFNARPFDGTAGGSGLRKTERLCYTGYFRVTLGDNYGLWFGTTILFMFFVLTLMFGEKPITDPEYQENVWTHHPLYSLYRYGNELHTRKTRGALFMATLTIHGLFSSLWYSRTDEDKRMRSSNTIVYGVYSMLINLVVTYVLGCMLRSYYLAKLQYHKTKDENWDQRAQNRIFRYYLSIFVVVVAGWAVCVWRMNYLHAEISNNASRMWVASFFIGLGLEFLIIDPIVCLLARSIEPIRNFAKWKGYMYDKVCHETYMLFLKMD